MEKDNGFQGMDEILKLNAISQPSDQSPTPGLDMRQFDGAIRPWTDDMGTECYCKGRGVVLDAESLMHWCICRQDDWPGICRRVCGIPSDVLDRQTFDTFVEVINPQAYGFKRQMERWAAKDVGGSPWQVLWGEAGTGKTHLIVATVGMLVARAVSVKYWESLELEAALKASIDTNEVGEFVRHLATVPVLAIDDLGKESQTPFVSGHFFRILNRRYADQRRTILGFNPEGYADLGASLRSRIMDMVVCNQLHFDGPDIRSTVRTA